MILQCIIEQKKLLLVESKRIIIVEGILVLEDERIRKLLDIKVYVDTDADIRILRRLVRDINERGRTVDSVIDQYLNSGKTYAYAIY